MIAFFLTLALYQLPDARLTVNGGPLPLFFVPLALLIPQFARALRAETAVKARPAFAVFALILIATLVTGLAHPDQDWLEATKRLAYILAGAIIATCVYFDRGSAVAGLGAYILAGIGLTVYGFLLLANGYGEAAHFFYFGLHYTASTRNNDAFFLLLPMFAAFGFGLSSSFSRGARLIFLSGGVLMAGALGISQSRGAWIATLIGLVALIVLARQRVRALILGAAVALLVTLAVAIFGGLGGFGEGSPAAITIARGATIFDNSSSANSSNFQRLQLTSEAFTIIGENPLIGVGVGKVGDHLLTNPSTAGLLHLENTYLNLWAEYGLLGLAAVLSIVGYALIRLRPNRTASTSDVFNLLLLCGVIAIAIDSLTSSNGDSAHFWVLLPFVSSFRNPSDS
jgi:O-antigen ligase